jgi:cytochrome c oxidase cbb3-type subunit 2
MKNGPLFVLGIFLALVTAWCGVLLGSHAQLGFLTPFFDEGEGVAHPQRPSGLAARGELVYADLGCVACHTQQVRRPGNGNDQARGWGDRQSVARHYLFQNRPQLGSLRFGPDLTNLAQRKPEAPKAEALYLKLYQGSATHPSYKFLFKTAPIAGEVSAQALKVSGLPGTGHQVVPTERARSLVAYLLSLRTDFEYPEARPLPKPEPAATKPEGKK